MSRATLHRLLLRAAVFLTAVAITVVPVISKVQVATLLGVAFAVGAVAVAAAPFRPDWRAAAPGLVLVAGLVVWMALGLTWAVDPDFSSEKLGRVLPVLLLGPAMVLFLHSAGRSDGAWMARILPVCVVAGMVWILVGWGLKAAGLGQGGMAAVFPSGVGVNPGLTTLEIVLWLLPMAAVPLRRQPGFVLVVVAAAVLLLTGESAAAALGFIVGGGVYLSARWRPRAGTAAMVGRTVAEVERDLIIDTLSHCLGNRTHAANILGISIRTLRNKLKQYAEAGVAVPLPGDGERPAF